MFHLAGDIFQNLILDSSEPLFSLHQKHYDYWIGGLKT